MNLDAVAEVRDMTKLAHDFQVKVIWASARHAGNFRDAQLASCDIVTLAPPILTRLMEASSESTESVELRTAQELDTATKRLN
jgi:transaldolase